MLEPGRISAFLTTIVVITALLYNIWSAMKGKVFHVRDIPAVKAIEEYVGRATEMGRPVHFTPGISALAASDAPEVFAGLQILSHLAKLCARYDSRLIATAVHPDTLIAVSDTIREAYFVEGKSENFIPTDVRYLSAERWAYAAGVAGIMSREKVATNILVGSFGAETLLLAEASFQAGAAQIAGSTNMYQVPFFVAACDYTLIGEEMFVAGAIVAEAPAQIGSIAGQDFGKAIAVILLLVGIISQTLGSEWLKELMKL